MSLVLQNKNGENFGFSFQRFRKWKKRFKKKYKEIYGNNFSQDFPDRDTRIAIYERLLRVEGTKILKGKTIELEKALNIEKINKIMSLVDSNL